jgi:hypothetical protein
VPAVGAHGVHGAHLAAILARHQGGAGQGVVSAPAIAAALGVLAFWMGRHDFVPSALVSTRIMQNNACREGRQRAGLYAGAVGMSSRRTERVIGNWELVISSETFQITSYQSPITLLTDFPH